MIDKLTIEQLERLKNLAIANNEYGIAGELCIELSERYKDKQKFYESEIVKNIVNTLIN